MTCSGIFQAASLAREGENLLPMFRLHSGAASFEKKTIRQCTIAWNALSICLRGENMVTAGDTRPLLIGL